MSRELLRELYQHAPAPLQARITSELEKPEPEPMGYVNPAHVAMFEFTRIWRRAGRQGISMPLYAIPTQQKPLSENEIRRIRISTPTSLGSLSFARAIEKAHKIGETK